ncbi:predicted protein [Lichtheimia corymbifera JMRC:FSU:9682]|uniref:Uncharacterized protein n=1 Tax=Lichtheimia corymbifera JMRC:FSU:9682 TaxID=1263082 RepID=A0A068RI17_9FUNG|nr:predicted protein [Lichtheimia corymbifera JMRC:FSU:9682]
MNKGIPYTFDIAFLSNQQTPSNSVLSSAPPIPLVLTSNHGTNDQPTRDLEADGPGVPLSDLLVDTEPFAITTNSDGVDDSWMMMMMMAPWTNKKVI